MKVFDESMTDFLFSLFLSSCIVLESSKNHSRVHIGLSCLCLLSK